MTSPDDYSVFIYMYRDAANFKAGGQLLLKGAFTKQAESVLNEACDSWDHFVAEQVGVPTLYAELYQYSGGPTVDDIAFHEFQHLRPAIADDIETTLCWGTLATLLHRFRNVRRWDCSLSPHVW